MALEIMQFDIKPQTEAEVVETILELATNLSIRRRDELIRALEIQSYETLKAEVDRLAEKMSLQEIAEELGMNSIEERRRIKDILNSLYLVRLTVPTGAQAYFPHDETIEGWV